MRKKMCQIETDDGNGSCCQSVLSHAAAEHSRRDKGRPRECKSIYTFRFMNNFEQRITITMFVRCALCRHLIYDIA